MFRNLRPSDLNPKNFGAASTIAGDPSESWVVVNEDGKVRLMNLQTFQMVPGHIEVEDPNWLTESQARELVRLIDNNYTFSDYTLLPKGFK